MKIKIEADSQEEFDDKREELIKAIAGTKLKVKISKIYDLEKPAIAPRRSPFKAQNQMIDYWQVKWESMLKDIKAEINEVLK